MKFYNDINFIIRQLYNIYIEKEWWHTSKLEYIEFYKYTDKLLSQGNIILYTDDKDIVLGYVEFWRITFEQWGRMVCRVPMSGYLENIKDGKICVVHNVFIKEEHRRGLAYKWLKLQFFKANRDCDYYAGIAIRKKTQPIKVFHKNELKSELFTGV